MTKLQYRGVSYDNATHEHLDSTPVEHIYRGQHFEAPLSQELHYRGHVYHQRAANAADQVHQS
jgi:hypothetical protein